jgi:hypothetical protein
MFEIATDAGAQEIKQQCSGYQDADRTFDPTANYSIDQAFNDLQIIPTAMPIISCWASLHHKWIVQLPGRKTGFPHSSRRARVDDIREDGAAIYGQAQFPATSMWLPPVKPWQIPIERTHRRRLLREDASRYSNRESWTDFKLELLSPAEIYEASAGGLILRPVCFPRSIIALPATLGVLLSAFVTAAGMHFLMHWEWIGTLAEEPINAVQSGDLPFPLA